MGRTKLIVTGKRHEARLGLVDGAVAWNGPGLRQFLKRKSGMRFEPID
jgi:hypothetical protein